MQESWSTPSWPYRVFYVVDDEAAVVHVIDVVHTARETKLAAYRD